MDNPRGNLFAKNSWDDARARHAPFLATAVAVAKLGVMTAPAINDIRQLFATPELPSLGPDPRASVQSEAALNTKLDSIFHKSNFLLQQQQLIRSLVLLWHDHFDAAHIIAQAIENQDGSFVHAIIHRREPDYFNAKYWWRRVGAHPAFPEIARRVNELLNARGAGELAAKLLPGGGWDAVAFVDACEHIASEGSPRQAEWLREIQRVETEVLSDFFCHE